VLMYYVYILELSNGKFCVGFSSDLRSRIKEHKNKRLKATKLHTLVKLKFYSAFDTETKAIRFEKYLKTMSGFAFRNKRLI